jgi:hypothetical protein
MPSHTSPWNRARRRRHAAIRDESMTAMHRYSRISRLRAGPARPSISAPVDPMANKPKTIPTHGTAPVIVLGNAIGISFGASTLD